MSDSKVRGKTKFDCILWYRTMGGSELEFNVRKGKLNEADVMALTRAATSLGGGAHDHDEMLKLLAQCYGALGHIRNYVLGDGRFLIDVVHDFLAKHEKDLRRLGLLKDEDAENTKG